MFPTRRQGVGVATLVAGTLAVSACGSDGPGDGVETITLSYWHFAPATTFPVVQMEEWADQLNERTDGQVGVEIFAGGSLLAAGDTVPIGMSMPDVVEAVNTGVIEGYLSSREVLRRCPVRRPKSPRPDA